MRIAVVHVPRSGSSKLVRVLAKALGMEHITGVLSGDGYEHRMGLIPLLWERDNYIIKVETTSTLDEQVSAIDWGRFDYVIKLTRASVVDAYLSFQVARQRNNFVKFEDDNLAHVHFTVDMDDQETYFSRVAQWHSHGPVRFKEWVALIESALGMELLAISYDEVMDDAALLQRINSWGIAALPAHLQIATKPSNIDYPNTCLNYAQVVSRFQALGLL